MKTKDVIHAAIINARDWEERAAVDGELTPRQTREVLLAVIEMRDQMLEALRECRPEITRLNASAGETVFNPSATELIDAAIAKAEGRAQ